MCISWTYARLHHSTQLISISQNLCTTYTNRILCTTSISFLATTFVWNMFHSKNIETNTGWGISWLTPIYPTNGLSYAPGSQYIVVGGKAERNAWHGCHGRHLGSWDKGVLIVLCLKGVLTELCLTLYFSRANKHNCLNTDVMCPLFLSTFNKSGTIWLSFSHSHLQNIYKMCPIFHVTGLTEHTQLHSSTSTQAHYLTSLRMPQQWT
jgi:hypothetical protein